MHRQTLGIAPLVTALSGCTLLTRIPVLAPSLRVNHVGSQQQDLSQMTSSPVAHDRDEIVVTELEPATTSRVLEATTYPQFAGRLSHIR